MPQAVSFGQAEMRSWGEPEVGRGGHFGRAVLGGFCGGAGRSPARALPRPDPHRPIPEEPLGGAGRGKVLAEARLSQRSQSQMVSDRGKRGRKGVGYSGRRRPQLLTQSASIIPIKILPYRIGDGHWRPLVQYSLSTPVRR